MRKHIKGLVIRQWLDCQMTELNSQLGNFFSFFLLTQSRWNISLLCLIRILVLCSRYYMIGAKVAWWSNRKEQLKFIFISFFLFANQIPLLKELIRVVSG